MTHKILFSPDQHPHFINVTFVDNLAELENQWNIHQNKYSEDSVQKEPFDFSTGAFCAFNHEGKEDLGDIIFFERSLQVIAHECTHAALSFVDCRVMSSSVVMAMPKEDQYEYYQEAIATTVENLFGQIEKLLDPKYYSAKIDALEGVLRRLALALGAGGYNSTTVDPEEFYRKIDWGIDQFAKDYHQLQLIIVKDKDENIIDL